VILVIMYDETFKSDFIVFHSHSVFDVTLTHKFQYQSQFNDTENITLQDQRKTV